MGTAAAGSGDVGRRGSIARSGLVCKAHESPAAGRLIWAPGAAMRCLARYGPGNRRRGQPASRAKRAQSKAGPGSVLRLGAIRSEEHTSELQSLMRISYAVFCLKKKKHTQ